MVMRCPALKSPTRDPYQDDGNKAGEEANLNDDGLGSSKSMP